ncbi:mitochondrial basic amino acids transporter isoform X1 [Drosophila pseudoobscura]|uniref:Mitochondrial basic amino acids transporter isoform X1 n=1 Tax=Drosophila pseudoobscura pseudoobscura TaxID=46245 RepID=A0A6I8VVW2_DROPS|nr:mitochondrial basic amino acids transporter isoform X1 [Drosophila pseudoobscura]XP_033235228.1 mitochondrial basic amino acids transporter isoform X1 [Drosophila pseudoobscura]XP_033235229.1 mitochondrial basic amino acids transporter isoform X1 [Drosophila pseudoobscura]XP_033235230.1 mitochondrial basic amino acids transporter isoform X1 [Drosophila pseudoobscura]
MFVDFIAGLMGGAAGVLVGHPLDTVKVHLQTDDPKNPKYKGTFHCLKKIIKKDNIQGLYRGISSPMSGIGLVNSIVFGVYGNIQRLSDDPNSLLSHFYAGSIAGLAQSFVCAPMELAKTRLQLSSQIDSGIKFTGPINCIRYIIKTEGVRGAFKGLTATIFRDIPGFSSYFVSYEYLMRQRDSPNIPYTLMAGGCAGIASWLACYPIDVIKTHMQADALGKNAKYNGFIDCAKKGFEKEGTLFFFRGLNSTLIRAFPMNAACFFVVSWIMDLFNKNGMDMAMSSDNPLYLVNLENTTLANLGNTSSKIEELVRNIITDNSILVQLISTHQDITPNQFTNNIYNDSDNFKSQMESK